MHGYEFDALFVRVIVAAVTVGVDPLYWDLGLLEVVVDAIACLAFPLRIGAIAIRNFLHGLGFEHK